MTKPQLNVRSEEAYLLAHKIADETKRSVVDVVVQALRDYGDRLPKREGMTPAQWATYQALLRAGRDAAKRKKPGATSDHSDLYDEYGLPI